MGKQKGTSGMDLCKWSLAAAFSLAVTLAAFQQPHAAAQTSANTQPSGKTSTTTSAGKHPIVVGKVTAVSVRNGVSFSGPFELKDQGGPSVVLIELEGRENDEFIIPTEKIVKMDGFKDLDGKQNLMGGLFLLKPLQARLEGTVVELTYANSTKKDGTTTYLVTRIVSRVSKAVDDSQAAAPPAQVAPPPSTPAAPNEKPKTVPGSPRSRPSSFFRSSTSSSNSPPRRLVCPSKAQ